jgi:RNA polymerase sigma-70 factor (ECF subfamily)
MKMGNTETARYLKSWHEGDRQGLEALLELHLPWIHEQVHKRMGPVLRMRGETGDFVQETVVNVLQYGPRFIVSDKHHFRALLYKIVENTLKKQYRRYTAKRREIKLDRPLPSDTVLRLDPPDGSVQTPSKVVAQKEREEWIRLGLELIEPDDQEIINLRQRDELSFAEIGERLGISEGAAQMRHTRTVRRLVKKVRALRSGKVQEALDQA